MITLTAHEYHARPSHMRGQVALLGGAPVAAILRSTPSEGVVLEPVLIVEPPLFPGSIEEAENGQWEAFLARMHSDQDKKPLNCGSPVEIDEAMYMRWGEIKSPLMQAGPDDKILIDLGGALFSRPLGFAYAEGEDYVYFFWEETQPVWPPRYFDTKGTPVTTTRYFCQRGPWDSPERFFLAHRHRPEIWTWAPAYLHKEYGSGPVPSEVDPEDDDREWGLHR